MGLSRCHCINIRRANKAVTEYYDRMLKPCGVTINQFAILRTLQRLENASVRDLADEMGLDRSTLVRTVRPLLESGLAVDNSEAGSRNRSLNLSSTGKAVLRRGAPLWDRAQRGLEEKLGSGAMEALGAIVETLQRL